MGARLLETIRATSFSGVTGNVRCDVTKGTRTEFHLDVIVSTEGGLNKIGFWNKGESKFEAVFSRVHATL